MAPDWLQHVRPASSVFAQQYSSTAFVSLSFHSRQEKFGTLFKYVILSMFSFFFN
jgi:hypothetical protein